MIPLKWELSSFSINLELATPKRVLENRMKWCSANKEQCYQTLQKSKHVGMWASYRVCVFSTRGLINLTTERSSMRHRHLTRLFTFKKAGRHDDVAIKPSPVIYHGIMAMVVAVGAHERKRIISRKSATALSTWCYIPAVQHGPAQRSWSR
jgi:hypothetical protein